MSTLASAPGLHALLAEHWQPAWPLDAVALVCASLYLRAAQRVRDRWPRHASASFLAGLAVVLFALQSGLDVYGERLLSAHMIQHMLLMLVAPPLLLGGRPVLLALRTLAPSRRRLVARALTRLRPFTGAVACLVLFNAVLLLVHAPPVFEAALRDPLAHAAEHSLLLAAGLALWWPLSRADPSPARRPGAIGRIVYLLAAMPAMTVIGAYLDRAPTPVYPIYTAPARALGSSGVADQQQAGAIMWVLGSSFLIAVGLWMVMAAMLEDERRQKAREQRALVHQGGDEVIG